jgi:hypothetical protein
MAIITGGLHGRPGGKLGGVVYSAARTREGKVVTAREKVDPAYSNTPDQIIQRNIFKEALYATRYLTAAVWQEDWNRSIGQLPGFQSMMSIIMNNTDASEDFTAPPDTPLGNLHFPITAAYPNHASPTNQIDMTWSTELGLNGTANDTLEAFCIHSLEGSGQIRLAAPIVTSAVRSDGAEALVVPTSGEIWVICVYFKGAGVAEGLLSKGSWHLLNMA